MVVTFLCDENLPGRLINALRRHNARGLYVIDFVQVGEPADLPLGSLDPVVLQWAERNNRVLVTLDKNTLPIHLTAHVGAGQSCPGILVLRPLVRIADIVDYLALAAHASDLADWRDRIWYIP